MNDVRLVTTQARLDELARELSDTEAIAVDVEADGLFVYRAKLCMLQFAWKNGDSAEIAIVDPFTVDLTVLGPVLSGSGPLKVLHDLTFDARMLAEANIPLDHVRDTSVAARFLGEQATGLQRMVQSRLGIELTKTLQEHDWAKRPLLPAELEYLAADVRHLLALDAILEGEVMERGMADEVELECQYKLATALRPPRDERPLHVRIKGYGDLDDVGRSVLRRLVATRERLAEAADVPPFRIVRNEVLIDLARHRPTSELDLRRGFGRDRAVQHLVDWQHAVTLGLADEPEPKPVVVAPPPDFAERRAFERTLSHWRRRCAEERGVDPQVVVPGHCMDGLALALFALGRNGLDPSQALNDVEGLGAFRILRYGAEWRNLGASLALSSGEGALASGEGAVSSGEGCSSH